MSDSIRDFLKTRGGIILAAAALLAVVAFAVSSLINGFGTSQAGAHSRDRLFICAESRKAFRHQLEAGEPVPVVSPYSGENTGYPAELCYWTADGEIKQEPTAVLLNTYVDDPSPTFCPDCGRLVRPWNPRPVPGQAPPTRDELEAGRANVARHTD